MREINSVTEGANSHIPRMKTVAHHTAGFHLCYSNPSDTMVSRALIALLPTRMKAKMKVRIWLILGLKLLQVLTCFY